MFDSIFIGMSGLQSFSAGLRVISNNVANLNTPGFKSAEIRFADLYYQSGSYGGNLNRSNSNLFGTGVGAGQTFLNFQSGESRQTGNPLDLSVGGTGFFITRGADGSLTYTRAGQFEFNKDGVLISRTTGREVMGLGSGGGLAAITLNGLRLNPPKATAQIKLTGNLSSNAPDFAIDSVKVFDALGGERTLRLSFKPKDGAAGTWVVTAIDGETEVGKGEVGFVDGKPAAGSDKVAFTYTPTGLSGTAITLDFSSQVTSFSTGTFSSLAATSTDGHAVGSLTKLEFDAKGVLSLTYSNGEKASGLAIALADFESNIGLESVGDGEFAHPQPNQARLGTPGSAQFGGVASSQIEVSNVDLSTEFSDLIVTQRGYQASSRIVSTANEMLQELFEMKGRR
jgi:flagellar hook protein FlgE